MARMPRSRPAVREPASPWSSLALAALGFGRLGALERVGVLTLVVAALGFATAASSSATHLPVHPCADASVRAYRVTHIATNYSCAQTYRALRRLLRRGVHRLPKLTIRFNTWGCGQAGPLHICTRYGRGNPGRISFEVARRK